MVRVMRSFFFQEQNTVIRNAGQALFTNLQAGQEMIVCLAACGMCCCWDGKESKERSLIRWWIKGSAGWYNWCSSFYS